jgi:hypothetical protein
VNAKDWKNRAKTALRTEMSRQKVTAIELSRLLAEIGVDEEPGPLGTKISRGTFSAAFLFQCLTAMKIQNLHIGDS